jgi:mxaA protein
VLAIAALALTASAAHALQTIEPRPFGYTVGDVLERRLLVDRSRDGTMDPASLPRPGRFGRWFQLREVTSVPDGVRLAYQIVNAPTQPQQENLPSLSVRVMAPDGRVREAAVGPYTVTITPVAHFGPDDVVQSDNVRPDLDPSPIDTARRRERVIAYAAALAALVAVQLAPALARRLGWRPAGPFARARRALRRSPWRGDDVGARRQALACLHRALDEAAGRTLALDNAELLFSTHPWLRPAREDIESLLADSRAAFFGDAPPPPRERLLSVAGHLADLERRR